MKLKNIKRKRLNNKGFTLIELLAVIVILAIVMGIAATSVISIINNSRQSGLQDSAASAADAFRVAYGEMSLSNSGKILGISTDTIFTNTATSVNLEDAADSLNITADNYDLTKSFVYYDPANSKFTVCMVANPTGSYYVAAARGETKTLGQSLTADDMWACSDNTNSWS